jgi:hypothetical protein
MREETGTIALVAETDPPKLGDTVHFACTFDPPQLDKRERGGVRVQVVAHDPTNGEVIYASAGHYDEPFLLGGGWSRWLEQNGPAHCVATLYYWDYKGGKQSFVPLAETTFEAAGK